MNFFKSILNNLKVITSSQNFIAKQIHINQLSEELNLLLQGKTEFDFIGINSNGDDCLYFAKNENNFNIEYEAIEKSQIQYYENLKNFASKNNFKIEENINNKVPYLKINTNSSLEETVYLAKEIQRTIFGNNDETKYDIVP